MVKIKKALQIVERLKKEWYEAPKTYRMSQTDFYYTSYESWALREVKTYLMIHSDQNPIDALDEFRYQMDCAAVNAKTETTNFIFSICYDVATDVLDNLLM